LPIKRHHAPNIIHCYQFLCLYRMEQWQQHTSSSTPGNCL
jgi:hypothetical protein